MDAALDAHHATRCPGPSRLALTDDERMMLQRGAHFWGDPPRTKVIGRLPGERSCLTLVWAVLDRASRGWRGLTYTPAATRLLQDLRRELFGPPEHEVIDQPVTTAA
jgi:hypothetical protein